MARLIIYKTMKAKKREKLDKLAQKSIRKKIENQLLQALQIWRRDLGDEEFALRVKKASKLFAKDISQSTEVNLGLSA